VSDRVENAGYMERNDAKVLSEVMDEIRAVIVDCKVSIKIRVSSVTQITNGPSLLYLRLAYPANRLHPRRGPVSDATS